MYVYCLCCNTVKRDEVAVRIQRSHGVHCIAPKIIQRKWIKGKSSETIHEYLPGYVFLYADEPIVDLASLRRNENIYRILGEHDNNHQLIGNDLAFAEWLFSCGGVVGVLKAYKEGDRVKLANDAMGNVEGEIVKIDRRGRALVRFGFDGTAIQSWVALEMIKDEERCAPRPVND